MSTTSLCIDLGASFTKVVYRPADSGLSMLLTGLTGDGTGFVSSAIGYERESREWMFGDEAYHLVRSEGHTLYTNWKNSLYSWVFDHYGDDPNEYLAHPTFLRDAEPVFLLGKFLTWLAQKIAETYPEIDLRETPTYLCVPEFAVKSPFGIIVDEKMVEAGFTCYEGYRLSEPHAGLIGILTEGRNQRTAEGVLIHADMLRGVFEHRSEFQSRDNAVVFVDIGSFTVDFSITYFSYDKEESREAFACESLPKGLSTLTRWLEETFVLEGATLAETDRRRANVLEEIGKVAGQPEVSLLFAKPVEALRVYCNEVAGHLAKFIRSSQLSHSDSLSVALSGGGSLIPCVVGWILEELVRLEVPVKELYVWKDFPGGAATRSLRRMDLKEELIRANSAFGGASVYFAPPVERTTVTIEVTFAGEIDELRAVLQIEAKAVERAKRLRVPLEYSVLEVVEPDGYPIEGGGLTYRQEINRALSRWMDRHHRPSLSGAPEGRGVRKRLELVLHDGFDELNVSAVFHVEDSGRGHFETEWVRDAAGELIVDGASIYAEEIREACTDWLFDQGIG